VRKVLTPAGSRKQQQQQNPHVLQLSQLRELLRESDALPIDLTQEETALRNAAAAAEDWIANSSSRLRRLGITCSRPQADDDDDDDMEGNTPLSLAELTDLVNSGNALSINFDELKFVVMTSQKHLLIKLCQSQASARCLDICAVVAAEGARRDHGQSEGNIRRLQGAWGDWRE
jgi:hypothetical protein